MKKHLLMLASWSMLFLGAASFTSCGDDEDDDDAKVATISQQIVGTWSYDAKASNTTLEDDDFMDIREITFNEDKSLSFIDSDEETFKGTYTLTDKAIKLDAESESHQIVYEKGEVLEEAADTDGNSYSITITDYSVEVSGDKLTITATLETVTKKGEKTSKKTDTMTSVFNKKK